MTLNKHAEFKKWYNWIEQQSESAKLSKDKKDLPQSIIFLGSGCSVSPACLAMAGPHLPKVGVCFSC